MNHILQGLVRALIAFAALTRSAFADPAYRALQDELPQVWNFSTPLRICTASIEDFGARCNGAPVPQWEGEQVPAGDVPQGGWCVQGVHFCGYDIEVWGYE